MHYGDPCREYRVIPDQVSAIPGIRDIYTVWPGEWGVLAVLCRDVVNSLADALPCRRNLGGIRLRPTGVDGARGAHLRQGIPGEDAC